MTYDYNDSTGGYGNTDEDSKAPDVEGNAGACPPRRLWYRIYPEIDFSAEFSSPPQTVTT